VPPCKSLPAWRRKTDDSRYCYGQRKTMRGKGQCDLRAPGPGVPRLIDQDATGHAMRRKTETAHTCLSRGKTSWFLPSACFTYSNAGSTSAALPSRTRLATLLSPSRNRARTDARQSVHTAKSTSSSSIYVVRANRRAIFRQALKARGKGERTRWMSARPARPGELVTSVCSARRLLCSADDEDFPADTRRGIWTVTESGPKVDSKATRQK
jgi:hypothetical protein